MTKDFLKGMLVAGVLVAVTQVNATGFNKLSPAASGKVMSDKQFETIIADTKSEDIAKNFGFPDQILSLNNPNGDLQGVVWVYKGAVEKADGLKDARIVFIKGKMQYFALSNAV